jgi:hypothetical protein
MPAIDTCSLNLRRACVTTRLEKDQPEIGQPYIAPGPVQDSHDLPDRYHLSFFVFLHGFAQSRNGYLRLKLMGRHDVALAYSAKF